jgi:hypothetical protein
MHRTPCYISLRIIYILFFINISVVFPLQASPFIDAVSEADAGKAKTVTFIRDYTYNASENDSKVSARRAALEQLQKAAIEEVGVHVQSSVVNHDTVTQGTDTERTLKREMQLNFKTFSQALTKTKILEEKWNGESFYIKAEIEVDPNGITAAMKSIEADKPIVDVCKDNSDKVEVLWQKPANTERNQALYDIAITANFDDDCNRWQYGVLSSLTRHTNYPIPAYREFLFSQVSSVKAYELPDLLPKVINYAIRHSGNTTEEEWKVILAAMQRIPQRYVYSVLRSLSYLNAVDYKNKINDIISLASSNKLGDPAISKESAIQGIIKVSLEKHKQLTAKLYLAYADQLSDIDKLTPTVIKIYQWGHLPENNEFIELADEVFEYFINSNDLDSANEVSGNNKSNDRTTRALYQLIQPLMNERSAQDPKNQYLKDLIQHYPSQFAYVIESQKIHESYKNLFLLKYNLPSNNLCSPAECAKQAANRELSTTEQNLFLDYLVAYGNRAKPVEKNIVKLLDRSRAMGSSALRTHRKTQLIIILANIKTTNSKAIDLLITSLKDFDYKVPHTAITTLSAIGMPAFERMKVVFADSEDLSKRRMVEAMREMPPSKDILTFLQSLPVPKNQALKFAIEDAIEVHESAQ